MAIGHFTKNLPTKKCSWVFIICVIYFQNHRVNLNWPVDSLIETKKWKITAMINIKYSYFCLKFIIFVFIIKKVIEVRVFLQHSLSNVVVLPYTIFMGFFCSKSNIFWNMISCGKFSLHIPFQVCQFVNFHTEQWHFERNAYIKIFLF